MEAVERMDRDCLPHWKCPRSESDVRFVIFLACEVGGSKFIENSREQVQINIARSNVRMYENVFPWLQVLAVAPPSSSASLSMPCHAMPCHADRGACVAGEADPVYLYFHISSQPGAAVD